MSKAIKQMEMDALRKTLADVRDFVLLSHSKVDCQMDYHLRAALRKKNIRMQMVKNSLARRVFQALGMNIKSAWEGNTLIAWGSNSLAELSKELDTLLKKNDKFKFKGAVSEGQEIDFKTALAMPTRPEALGRIVTLAIGPASRLAGQLTAPASRLCGQIKEIGKKEETAGPVEAAAPAAG